MPDVNIQPADEKMPELPLGMKMEDTAEIPDDFEEQVVAGNLERGEVGHVFKGGKEINLGQGKNRDIDIKIHHYFNDAAMTELMRQLDVEPKEQQNVLKRYVKQIVEEILPYIECPDDVGALINLDFPTNVRGLKNQVRNLISTIREASDSDREILEMLDDKESEGDLLEIYKASVARVRKDVIKLLNEEIKEKGLKKEIYVSGDYYGHGGMGTVFSCHAGKVDVAMKFLHKKKKKHIDKAGEKDLITATLTHPNLVDYYGHLIAEVEGSDQDVEFYEELIGAQSLTDYIRNSDMIDKKNFAETFNGFLEGVFIPALGAIKALHNKGLVHRDIKLDNFFIIPKKDDFTIKVGDYDLVCGDGYDSKDPEGRLYGTISHMSPEQWNWGIITCNSDIFSLGMTMYYLLGGKMPRNLSEAMERGRYGDVDTSELHATPEMKDLVGRCLKKNPEERPDIDELIDQISTLAKKTKEAIKMEKNIASMNTVKFNDPQRPEGQNLQGGDSLAA